MRVMIFGCGYSGQAIAEAFMAEGATVSGTVRSEEKAVALRAKGIRPFIFDGSEFDGALPGEMAEVTHLVQSIPPGHEGDPLLKLIDGKLSALFPKLEWIGYLSTVGVYGDHGGDWVTEETPGSPILGRSIERVDTEDAWSEQATSVGVPCAVLRLSGIYGPGRNAFVNLSRGSARRIIKKGQVFNRIRVEDIGGASLFLGSQRMGGLYNVTDDEPCPPQDVIVEAARMMGVEPPPEQDFDTADMSPMARSFYGANKRVSNEKIRAAGFQFRFPNYHVSLSELWSSDRWRA
ncbi:NAD(P)-dependent oxidoreductase [Rhizobium sp. Leaf306]|uniref:SDR family oxidoreductase n=1 Tax=Rhizobium sp. Leaf306 TaxID=1736330 RepID=UPI000713FFA0|nr:SDR family oxidoreductase [Rhizobium sp. Leaf306]KQQ38452.1 NAD(P)-dependent oxidoreductase [Rhizobium sp. Leaf306]